MQFSGSYIDKATFIIDNNRQLVPSMITNDVTVNLLGEKKEILTMVCCALYGFLFFCIIGSMYPRQTLKCYNKVVTGVANEI